MGGGGDISENTLESAADLYLDRYARLVSQGMNPAEAKLVCMHMAKVWLAPDRTKWVPEITAALAERIATIAIKRDLGSAITRLVDENKRREVDSALREELATAARHATDAATKRELKLASERVRDAQLREAGFVRLYAARFKDVIARLLGLPAAL